MILLNILFSTKRMDFVPGYCQGFTKVCISYPFDYVRTYLQTGAGLSAQGSQALSIRKILKTNNFKLLNLYRGVKYPLTITPIDCAVSYKLFEDMNKKHNPFISSLAISSVTCLFSVPFQTINTNYIIHNLTFRNMIKKHNFSFLFKSYPIEYCRMVTGTTIYMGIYGNLRANFPDEKKYCMANALISNLASWLVIYPLDTIRVNNQINNLTLMQTVKQKYKSGGDTMFHRIRSFYRGISVVCVRTIPASTISMLVYESVKKSIN